MNQRKVQETLVAWVREALWGWAEGKRRAETSLPPWLAAYGAVLSSSWSLTPAWDREEQRRLISPFEIIPRSDGESATEPRTVGARALSLDHILPGEAQEPGELVRGFENKLAPIMEDSARNTPDWFETVGHLVRKYAWAVPCSYGARGVSLYEEFKALTALVYASRESEHPADKFWLVGGDLPGIQDFLYTITSRGAARSLRGRSFFLQLLGDAIVRRLIADLGLSWANAVYTAGGNFMVLAPAGKAVEDKLEKVRHTLNRALLDVFEGDLYLALGWEELSRCDMGGPAFSEVRDRLGQQIAAAKQRRFAEVAQAEGGWEAIFGPKGQGGPDEEDGRMRYCAVCHRELARAEQAPGEPDSSGQMICKCALCESFEDLARKIACAPLWMVVRPAEGKSPSGRGWQALLSKLTGFDYRFEHDASKIGGGGTIYALNPSDSQDFQGSQAHGFRFVANVTPRITEKDLAWAEEHRIEEIKEDDIKDFSLMARQAQGIARVGVLRMDMDNLGALFGRELQASLPQVSALSAALDLFFSGHLNKLCQEVEGQTLQTLYTIYAGGDDLFIVGAWDRLPVLAARIRESLRQYTQNHPRLTISGGVTLESERFPLYRAAERSGEAEKKAKDYCRAKGHGKDAFCFLGMVVGWEEWKLVEAQKNNLLWLIGEHDENEPRPEKGIEKPLPRSLLQTVASIYQLYQSGLAQARHKARERGLALPKARAFLGRWAWMQVYRLTRMARASSDEQATRRIRQLQDAVLQPETVIYSGLIARWAEYLTRRTTDM